MNDTLFMRVYSRTVLLVEEEGKSWEADASLADLESTSLGTGRTEGRITRTEE
jgi:hypothetical protein